MVNKQSNDQLLSSENKEQNSHDAIKKQTVNKNNKNIATQQSVKEVDHQKSLDKKDQKGQIKVDNASVKKNDESVAKIAQPKNLPKEIFDVTINEQAIFDTVISERASRRQGTHKVKDRAEVRGGGKKPWRQKGTGRARAGSIRSPIWVGGGRVFGPTPERNYKLKVNKKVRKLALNSALSLKAQSQAILVYDFILQKYSTKELLMQLKDLNLNKNWKKFLIINNEDEVVFKSAQNVKSLKVNKISSLLVEDVLNADVIIFATSAWERLAK